MPQQLINIGAAAGDGTGDPARTAFDKVNDNFTELYEQTTAIDKTFLTSATLVALCHDWDGRITPYDGWRDRCSHTSWENEPLSGNWLGSAASEAAARAISGATTGSYYYSATAAKFYTLNAGAGQTETFRGNTRKFPADRLITAESDRVIIWNLTQPDAPMWMVFERGLLDMGGSGALASITAANAHLCLAGAYSGNTQAWVINLAADKAINYGDYYSVYKGNIASRNSGAGFAVQYTFGVKTILTGVPCNGIAITVLPNAPVDVATGLPVPTIAVATNGGVSVIKDDGNVWDFVVATYPAKHVWFDAAVPKRLFSTHATSVAFTDCQLEVIDIPSSDVTHVTAANRQLYDIVTTPAILGNVYSAVVKGSAIGSTVGVSRIKRNDASIAAGMIAYVTKDYNSGWQVGAIKGAWLADTVAETLTESVPLSDDFSSYADTAAMIAAGWANTASGTGTLDAGKIKVAASVNWHGSVRGFTTVIGKTYVAVASYDLSTGGSAVAQIGVGNSSGGGSALGSNAGYTATGSLMVSFVATATTTYINPQTQAGTWVYYDNIGIRLADVDRSGKAKGLQVFGSLTKAAVASGAQLMGYSGFSAANFFEQPYNSDLDFGTGDFCIMGWVKETPNSAQENILVRGAYSGAVWTGAAIQMAITPAGLVSVFITDDAYVTYDTITSSSAIDDSTFRLIALVRRSGYFELWFNGVKAATDVAVSAAAASLSNTAAVCKIGGIPNADGNLASGTLALWRASATAPSAEQIKHIYETEKALFEANAQCCLAGTSNAVTALAYCEETGILHVGTSWGRSPFKDLLRVGSEATPVGAITALAAGAGIVAQAGASGADVYVPAYSLREELLRDAEQMSKFGQNLVAHDFTATASQTTFTLPVGWEIVGVYQQGSLKRETTSWTRSFDGFIWSVVLGTGATVSDWISILAKRV